MTVLGLATARGGSTSLAHLLQEQGLEVGHEDSPPLPWEGDVHFGRCLRHMRRNDGDVAFWLLNGAARLLERLPDARAVAVLRPREETVASLKATMEKRRLRETETFGGMVFPAVQSWGAYWERWREHLCGLESGYPSRVLSVPLAEIETEEVQAKIAGHLGVEDWTHVADCHKNARLS